MSYHLHTRSHDNAQYRRTFSAATGVFAWLPVLMSLLLMAGLSVTAGTAFAEPSIRISFERSSADTQKLVHAEAVFPARQDAVYRVFEQIPAYPLLHDWIRKTTPVSAGEGSQTFRVEFKFPWPVGRQWSRVEVQQQGDTIIWRQVDGSIVANHGRISFTTVGDEVRVDYLAAIDIGLPEVVTQGYKARFVREFLTAACEQAATPTTAQALLLADAP
jgi:uncharacterized membrane protein